MLGANEGLVSTARLMVGLASSGAGSGAILTAGFAGVAASSLAMATGEYMSVSSQTDVEAADRARETAERRAYPAAERDELVQICSVASCPSWAPRREQQQPARSHRGSRTAGSAGRRRGPAAPTLRVLLGGSFAMLITAGVGSLTRASGA